MMGRRTLHGTANTPEAAAQAGQRPIVVRSIKKFAGVYQVTWSDGRRKRKILVAIDKWVTADDTVRDAVAATYPPVERPTVIVPANAWH